MKLHEMIDHLVEEYCGEGITPSLKRALTSITRDAMIYALREAQRISIERGSYCVAIADLQDELKEVKINNA